MALYLILALVCGYTSFRSYMVKDRNWTILFFVLCGYFLQLSGLNSSLNDWLLGWN